MKKPDISQILNALYILFLIVTCGTACKKNLPFANNGQLSSVNNEQVVADSMPPPDEIVAWIKPGRTHQEYENWLDSIKETFKDTVIEKDPCGSCDNTLFLLRGKGIKNYIQTGGTVAGGTTSGQKPPAVGEDGPMYVSRNFQATFTNPVGSSDTFYKGQSDTTYTGTVVKIAIFDTGADSSELTNFKYHSAGPACIFGADSGWNFINQTANYKDDNDIKHGTVVTRFITDQVVKYGRNKVEILPVKTHNKNGVGDLARILCALAYAKERGAKIINASFGFYLPPQQKDSSDTKDSIDPNARLFKEFVRHYLTKNGILLVAAAGNKDDVNEKAAFDLENLAYTSDPRNLDSVSFLPGSLAQIISLQNVITVTTVRKSNRTVSPRQNYSSNVVDIGVNADAFMGKKYVFNNPLFDNGKTVEGSSFATAIMCGILSANYDKYKSVLKKNNYTKEEIWSKLGKIVNSDPELKGIKGGRYVKK